MMPEERETDGIANPQQFTGPMLHMGVAEQGKLYALAGDHGLALQYYRKAMHMTTLAGDLEVFFRHYLECAVESMEHMGHLDEVIAYCDKAIPLYTDEVRRDPVMARDLAFIHERRGVVLLKRGELDAGRAALQAAVDLARAHQQSLPLAQQVLRWLASGFRVDAARLLAEQRRHNYFTIRPDNVDKSRAVQLPREMLLTGVLK